MVRSTPSDETTTNGPRVVYLVGAGATHGCAKAVGSAYGILMRDLTLPLAERVRDLLKQEQYRDQPALTSLVNAVIDENTDFEHIITFLDESASALHRQFANDLRKAFEAVLLAQLRAIEEEQAGVPYGLYQALLDMYNVEGCPENLQGVLTTNYDKYIEEAADALFPDRSIDFGIRVEPMGSSQSALRLIKLHGSFGWRDAWPVPTTGDGSPLWIPPGIQKAKERYPFNVLWGLARELLDCDVLRIIGVRLGANDWDLISLLFSTRHANANYHPYSVEYIGSPRQAIHLGEQFPYLDVRSLLDIDGIGNRLVSEFTGGPERPYSALTPEEQDNLLTQIGTNNNWFRLWLKQKAEALFEELGSIDTPTGALRRLMEDG